tara:strand:+ start:2842 stop:2994 length:153 start_codon:yes stop_codon:yes gene_type:complete
MGYNEKWRISPKEILQELEDLENLESWLMREHKQIYDNWYSEYYNEDYYE